ncbi:MAG: CHAT domain-containing protein [Candidatus Eisenbacteria bacterium]
MRNLGAAFVVLVLAFAFVPAARAAEPAAAGRGFPTPARWRSWAPELRRADSLLWAYRAPDAAAAARVLSQRARAERAAWPEMAADLIGAASEGLAGHGAEAERLARSSYAIARRLGERGYQRRATRWLAFALETQGRAAAAESTYRALLRAAVPARDTLHMGAAHLGMGYARLQRGELRAARTHYERAVPLLRAARNPVLHATARVGLARTLHGLGDFDAEQRIYMEVLAQSRREQVGRNEVDALTNLGTIEYSRGDALRAVRWWTLARERARSVPSGDGGGVAVSNLAMALDGLGRTTEATALLDSAVARARAAKQFAAVAVLETQRAEMLLLRERPREAREVARAARLELPAGYDAVRAVLLGLELRAGAQFEPDETVLAFAEREVLPAADAVAGAGRLELLARVARTQLEAGRFAEALATGDRALRVKGGAAADPTRTASVRSLMGDVLRALGRRAEARAMYARAIHEWESWRRGVGREHWSELRSFHFGRIPAAAEDLALEGRERDPVQVAASWQALERVRARAVLDRLQGGDGRAPEPPTLARVRGTLLAPGDLLLDFHTSDRATLLFVVTRTGARVVRLQPLDDLASALRTHFRMLASAPLGAGAAETGEPARVRLARTLLGEVEPERRRARRVIVVPDGPLALAPLEAMVADVAGASAPVVWRVPSASVWLALRERPRGTGARVLAWRGANDPELPSLRGADEEIAALRARFVRTDVRDGRRATTAPEERELAGYDVLHFAGHARALEESPWESGLLVADSTADGGTPWLTARRIAAMRLDARLAFLSGCSTANGRVVDGEGVAGLTAAFHAAGVGAVIASLWPVDDAATARLAAAFYARLAAGDDAATALDQARQALRRSADLAHPHWWAGFVLSGDGTVRPPLRRR